jgi:hypothetical protein
LQKGFKNIVAIGGDGTINEVANGFFTFHEQRGIEEERPENNNKQKKLVKACIFISFKRKDRPSPLLDQ